jgi:hypothetical protein
MQKEKIHTGIGPSFHIKYKITPEEILRRAAAVKFVEDVGFYAEDGRSEMTISKSLKL